MKLLKNIYISFREAVKILSRAISRMFWKDKRSAFLIYAALVCNGASWALLYWVFSREESGLILHYNAFLGIDVFLHFAESTNRFVEVFIVPIGGLCFFAINILVVLLLAMVLFPQNSSKKEILRSAQNSVGETAEILPSQVGKFGALLLLGGNFVLQVTILIYSIAVQIVNS